MPQGWALKANTELGGLGGTCQHFAKQRLDAQLALPLHPNVTLLFGASAGLILPLLLQPSSPAGVALDLAAPTCIADRFFLGGPVMHGFKPKGIGPTDVRRPAQGGAGGPGHSTPRQPAENTGLPKRDALGGDLFTSVMAAVGVQPGSH